MRLLMITYVIRAAVSEVTETGEMIDDSNPEEVRCFEANLKLGLVDDVKLVPCVIVAPPTNLVTEVLVEESERSTLHFWEPRGRHSPLEFPSLFHYSSSSATGS